MKNMVDSLNSIALVTSLLFYLSNAQYEDPTAFGLGGAGEPNINRQSSLPRCKFSICETIPEGMVYNNPDHETHLSTIDGWLRLIQGAQHALYIAAFYWTLTNTDSIKGEPGHDFPGIKEGIKIYEAIKAAALRNVTVKIVQNAPNNNHRCEDSLRLAEEKYAEVRNVQMQRYVGSGVLHTKFIIVDDKSFYLGSANMDWRALTHVKELGLLVEDCEEATHDLMRIFHVYWGLGVTNAIFPSVWPPEFETGINENYPLRLYTDHFEPSFMFLGSSPPKFCPPGRTTDLQAIVHVLRKARRFAFVSVMSYRPIRMYTTPTRFWGILDSNIRAAAFERRLDLRILTAKWKYFKDNSHHFLRSLMALSGVSPRVRINCKEFEVPVEGAQENIPYARVNHAKFIVTDNALYIGTSNWVGNYFIDTAGASVVLEGRTRLRQQLENIFMRDWNSEFAFFIPRDAQGPPRPRMNRTYWNGTYWPNERGPYRRPYGINLNETVDYTGTENTYTANKNANIVTETVDAVTENANGVTETADAVNENANPAKENADINAENENANVANENADPKGNSKSANANANVADENANAADVEVDTANENTNPPNEEANTPNENTDNANADNTIADTHDNTLS